MAVLPRMVCGTITAMLYFESLRCVNSSFGSFVASSHVTTISTGPEKSRNVEHGL